MAEPRRRTTAQRTRRNSDADESSRPITEEEQEAEIHELRAKNRREEATARLVLNGLVVVTICVTLTTAASSLSTSPLLACLSLLQAILLPLSFTLSLWSMVVNALPVLAPLKEISKTHHSALLAQHIALWTIAVLVLWSRAKLEPLEVLKWALPNLVAGAVDMQRRGEAESEDGLKYLETLRYDLKGA